MKIFLSLLLIASFCEQNFASTTEDFGNGCQTIKKGDQFWRNDIFSRYILSKLFQKFILICSFKSSNIYNVSKLK